jgi:hypothetical protein
VSETVLLRNWMTNWIRACSQRNWRSYWWPDTATISPRCRRIHIHRLRLTGRTAPSSSSTDFTSSRMAATHASLEGYVSTPRPRSRLLALSTRHATIDGVPAVKSWK